MKRILQWSTLNPVRETRFIAGERLVWSSSSEQRSFPAISVDHTGTVEGILLNLGIDRHLGIGKHHRPIDSPTRSEPNRTPCLGGDAHGTPLRAFQSLDRLARPERPYEDFDDGDNTTAASLVRTRKVNVSWRYRRTVDSV